MPPPDSRAPRFIGKLVTQIYAGRLYCQSCSIDAYQLAYQQAPFVSPWEIYLYRPKLRRPQRCRNSGIKLRCTFKPSSDATVPCVVCGTVPYRTAGPRRILPKLGRLDCEVACMYIHRSIESIDSIDSIDITDLQLLLFFAESFDRSALVRH